MGKYGLLVMAGVMATSLFGADASCRGCGAGKLMLQCDYYVVRRGETDKRHFCVEYAQIVDVDGASAKAAWYYLLGGAPEKALDAAKRALDQGQTFAAGYVAEALSALGKSEEAKSYAERFRKVVKKREYFVKEVETLKKLYPDADFSAIEE